MKKSRKELKNKITKLRKKKGKRKKRREVEALPQALPTKYQY
jgi:hypothetical protein